MDAGMPYRLLQSFWSSDDFTRECEVDGNGIEKKGRCRL